MPTGDSRVNKPKVQKANSTLIVEYYQINEDSIKYYDHKILSLQLKKAKAYSRSIYLITNSKKLHSFSSQWMSFAILIIAKIDNLLRSKLNLSFEYANLREQ